MDRKIVETSVRKLMVGDESKKMRKRATELKKLVEDSVSIGGSSYGALMSLVDSIMSS